MGALRRQPKDLTSAEKSIVRELADLTREGRVRIIGLIRQELLSGIRTAAQYEKLRVALRAFPDVPIDTPDYEAAAGASNACRARGIARSEEHTSELQSLRHLVCRLLLEK